MEDNMENPIYFKNLNAEIESNIKDKYMKHIDKFITSFQKNINILSVLTTFITLVILLVLLFIGYVFPTNNIYFNIIQYISIAIFFVIFLSLFMLYKNAQIVKCNKFT